jgi:hypothetical protein
MGTTKNKKQEQRLEECDTDPMHLFFNGIALLRIFWPVQVMSDRYF